MEKPLILHALACCCLALPACNNVLGEYRPDDGSREGGVVLEGDAGSGTFVGDGDTTSGGVMSDDPGPDDPRPEVTLGQGSGSSGPLQPGPSGSSSTEPNPLPTGVDGQPVAATEAGLGEFTRLTRAEYASTVWSALGIEPNVLQLPEDGRVGPFTSNQSVTPDPVHPYLLVAEDLAEQVVPELLPVCDASALAECIAQEYQPVIERLYRRAVRPDEVEVWVQLVDELLESGVAGETAQRALLVSVLTGPDFLFRSSSGSAQGTDGQRLRERVSYALLDAPPDAELQQGPSAAQTETQWLGEQVLRLLEAQPASNVIGRFIAQWLDVDTDLRLEDSEFAASPSYLELIERVQLALNNDVPVRDLIAGADGVVHRDNAALYGMDELSSSEAALTSVPWPQDSARRGLLAQELFAGSTRHPDATRRPIFRGLLVRRALLCDTIPAPSADLVALAGEVSDRTTDQRCSPCHTRLEPVGQAFAVWDGDGEAEVNAARIEGHAELEGTYADVAELLEAVAGSQAFAQCFSRHWLSFFLEQPRDEVDANWIRVLADEVTGGASLSRLIQVTVAELGQRSESFVPWCEAP